MMRDEERFRTNARECLEHAQSARTLQQRNHWTQMAQLWLNLAQHIEDSEEHEPTLPPPWARLGTSEGSGDLEPQ